MLQYDHRTGGSPHISPISLPPGIFDRAGRSSSPPAAALVFTALSTNEFGVLFPTEKYYV
ncbi:hypothetical protein ABIB68_005925 [Bradyrhizobium sp. F1.2.2]